MHEDSLMKIVLETVHREMELHGANRLNSLSLRIGTLTFVEPEKLRLAFDSSIEKTDIKSATLNIVETILTGRCRECGTEFALEEFDSPCPICSGTDIKRLTGTELDIISMDVD